MLRQDGSPIIDNRAKLLGQNTELALDLSKGIGFASIQAAGYTASYGRDYSIISDLRSAEGESLARSRSILRAIYNIKEFG